ncbi:hypothetical protein EB796_001372 [Bugula neritina]|uniref:Uncharacterized protein n=1 Tax=Bugula neritina TaxID=10212 RepID=A0A7J7KQ47_BUGNE|nr:hypothetical protein EB796_001372 [Bugula neritina]
MISKLADPINTHVSFQALTSGYIQNPCSTIYTTSKALILLDTKLFLHTLEHSSMLYYIILYYGILYPITLYLGRQFLKFVKFNIICFIISA